MKRLVPFLLAVGAVAVGGSARAEFLFGLTSAGGLVQFDSATPGTFTNSVTITGLGGQTLLGIDFRPATGRLYGLGNSGGLFTINTATGVATNVATLTVAPNGTNFGVDFNPVPDRLRIVSDANQNLRANVANGATLVDGTLAYAAADPNVGADPNIVAAGYTNSRAGPVTSTTLYAIDSALDILVTQNPPNAGVLNTIGALGVNASGVTGFDISGRTGTAYAALNVGGVSGLYTINLGTGAATSVGTFGGGLTLVDISAPVPQTPVPPTAVLMAAGLGAMLLRRRKA